MFSFIIRLDDACPTMNHENWARMEELLDRYGVKPIVGVIPECRDTAEDFQHECDPCFWEKVRQWQEKGWEISQHGLYHTFHDTPKGTRYFQKNIGDYTEFAGLPYEEQANMIKEGYQRLTAYGIQPTSFFAPAHTYDENTVKACKAVGYFRFISDGYALRVFQKKGMTFIPSTFDTPKKMPFGLYTFIYHPSKMESIGFEYLEDFLKKNQKHITNVEMVLGAKESGQRVSGWIIENGIHVLRRLRHHE